MRSARAFAIGILASALAVLGGAAARAQSGACYSLGHDLASAATDCIPVQKLGETRSKYQTKADLLAGLVTTTDPRLPLYNVRGVPYLAAGDGVADDTAAIAAAEAAACAAGGGDVRLPAGHYKITSHLAPGCAGVYLTGDGVGATFIVNASATDDWVDFGNPAAPYSPCGGIRNLSLTSTITKTAGWAIKVDGCTTGFIQNVNVVTTAGGNGIQFGATTSVSSAGWWLYGVDVALTGAFTDLDLESGNDRFIIGGWFSGDLTTGGTCIKINGSAGDWIEHVEAVLCGHGVQITPPSGRAVSWVDLHNLLVDSNAQDGWTIKPAAGGTVYGLTLEAPWAGSNGKTSITGYGMLLDGTAGTLGNVTISDPRIVNNGADGLRAVSMTDLRVGGGFMTANGQQAANTYAGLSMASVTGLRLSGVKSGNASGGSAQQKYGLTLDAATDKFTIAGNDFCGNSTAGISNLAGVGTTRRFGANQCDTSDAASTTAAGVVQLAAPGGTTAGQAVQASDARLSDARTPTAHSASHQNGGSDEVATATPGANAIPKAGAGGTLAPGWLPNPGASALGGVQSFAAVSNQWIRQISTAGVVTASQPDFSNLSGTVTAAQTPLACILGGASGGQTINGGVNAAEQLTLKGSANANTGGVVVNDTLYQTGTHGEYSARGIATELLTLSTSGTTTDTTANLLPANSIIRSVEARITTTITGATSWSVGDATTAARFAAANSTLTAGTTTVGLAHVDQTGAAGPRQTSAAKVRITTAGTPSAGVIRIVVFYESFVPPSS